MATSIKHNRRHVAHSDHMAELREQAATIGEDIKALAATAGAAAGQTLSPVESYIRSKPLKSMLMAVGAGAILSLVFWRR
ncbi:MAG TPA: hypothetical protein VNT79_07830 [Phycisphaerae bacterium]|nr:hypothetical protein [Phycisphaerae bacterium]